MMQDPMPQNVAAAYQQCLQTARQHYENFPTASLLIRADLRPAVAAIYAFARHADDLADEGQDLPAIRLKKLDAWETLLERCEDGSVEQPIFMALGDAMHRFGLPVELLHDLITAFRMDVSIHSYSSVDELMFYCRHSANPVGRLVLALHGIDNPEARLASDAICTGLQLANFWQDLSIDLPKGRCYLPAEWLHEAGLTPDDLLHGEIPSATLKPVLDHAIAHARNLFDEGEILLAYLPWRLRLQIAATLSGGRRILREVERSVKPLQERPTVSKAAWLGMSAGILLGALLPPKPKAIHA